MDDLISRQTALDTAIEAADRWDGGYSSEREGIIRKFFDKVPAAQPEIIRCKDCKHRDKYGCCKYWKGLAMADIPIATDDNDFCSYAEQKGEQCERKL